MTLLKDRLKRFSEPLWGVHWVSPRLGLTYGAAFNRHADLYDRRRVEVGWRVRF